jgi:hypothetical protein
MSVREVLDRSRLGSDAPSTSPRLAVAWRDTTGEYVPIGLLQFDGLNYQFCYVGRASQLTEFRPLLGLPDLYQTYRSERLFPMFAQRVMSPRRPDYQEHLNALSLHGDEGPMELLGRTQGQRHGDTVQLIPEPSVDLDGSTICRFLVNGIRHVLEEDPEIEYRLRQLQVGDALNLVSETTNEFNSRALLVTREGERLGWVPNLLLDYVHRALETGSTQVVVDTINGPGVSPHVRLSAILRGSVPVGYEPFSGPDWEPLTPPASDNA